MQTNVLLPQVELTMESALIARWLVGVGDRVRAGQSLLEVETQKAVSEIPSPADGFVRKLCVQQGQTVGEKAVLCILTESTDEPLDAAAQAEPVKASPAARKLARDLGVDLASIRGTGPNGRISEEDVRAVAKTSPAAPASQDDGWTPLPATRVAMIELMRKSLAEIPQLHIQRQLDVTPLLQKIAGITFTHRLIVAAAAALRQHPPLRTVIDATRTKVEPVSIAIAMDTPQGLLAPVLRNADQLSVEQVADAVKLLHTKMQSNSLKRAELTNAPFAISNLGMLGVDQFNAFVFHGQTAVMSVGRATAASDGRKHAWFGIAVDHRIVDGAEAARFLETLSREIGSK